MRCGWDITNYYKLLKGNINMRKENKEIIEDKFSKETKLILEKAHVLDNLEIVDYDFEWNLVQGLRFVSMNFI